MLNRLFAIFKPLAGHIGPRALCYAPLPWAKTDAYKQSIKLQRWFSLSISDISLITAFSSQVDDVPCGSEACDKRHPLPAQFSFFVRKTKIVWRSFAGEWNAESEGEVVSVVRFTKHRFRFHLPDVLLVMIAQELVGHVGEVSGVPCSCDVRGGQFSWKWNESHPWVKTLGTPHMHSRCGQPAEVTLGHLRTLSY